MAQVQDISFQDWSPIGKPRKKTRGNGRGSPGGVKDGTATMCPCVCWFMPV